MLDKLWWLCRSATLACWFPYAWQNSLLALWVCFFGLVHFLYKTLAHLFTNDLSPTNYSWQGIHNKFLIKNMEQASYLKEIHFRNSTVKLMVSIILRWLTLILLFSIISKSTNFIDNTNYRGTITKPIILLPSWWHWT